MQDGRLDDVWWTIIYNLSYTIYETEDWEDKADGWGWLYTKTILTLGEGLTGDIDISGFQ